MNDTIQRLKRLEIRLFRGCVGGIIPIQFMKMLYRANFEKEIETLLTIERAYRYVVSYR